MASEVGLRGEPSPALGRPVPMTYNRAATAVVRTRRLLEQAQDEARLAAEILAGMEEPGALQPSDPAGRPALLRALQDLLEQLEAAERACRGVWRPE